MEIALERIQKCIQNNKTMLDLSGLRLVKLPDNLPASLQTLYCSSNQLTLLPDNLPASLQTFGCSDNQLTSLPDNLPASLHTLYCSDNQLTLLPDNLPASLHALYCDNNQLTKLPDNLPTSLQTLYCSSNQLTLLPDNLPASLQYLYCHNNPYLHITKSQAILFNLKETPNYAKYANLIKNKRKAMKLYNRLKFCKKLKEHAMEFLLRPGNYYYTLLKQQNSHLFIQDNKN